MLEFMQKGIFFSSPLPLPVTTSKTNLLRRYFYLVFIGVFIFALLILRPALRSSSLFFFQESLESPLCRSPILLVTAYFPLPNNRSKHTQDEYSRWISGFLGNITTDLYMYVPAVGASFMAAHRGAYNPVRFNSTFDTVWQLPPFKGYKNAWSSLHALDREASIHSPDLYAVWAAKPYLVTQAMKNLETEGRCIDGSRGRYKYVFWVDAGSFRQNHSLARWPDLKRVEEVWDEGEKLTGTKKEDLVMIPIERAPGRALASWNESQGPLDYSNICEGSFFGGTPAAVNWYAAAFYAYVRFYWEHDFFVGKDQTVMNALILLHSYRFITVHHADKFDPNRYEFDQEAKVHSQPLKDVNISLADAMPQRPQVPSDEANPPSVSSRGLTSTSLVSRASHTGLGVCGDPWYYYIFWLASPAEQSAQARLWISQEAQKHPDQVQLGQDPASVFPSCRLSRVLSMSSVISSAFGSDLRWPEGTVNLTRVMEVLGPGGGGRDDFTGTPVGGPLMRFVDTTPEQSFLNKPKVLPPISLVSANGSSSATPTATPSQSV